MERTLDNLNDGSIFTSNNFDSNSRLLVNGGKLNVFGEQIITTYDPIVQNLVKFDRLNDQLYRTFLSGGGAVTPNTNTDVTISIGTGVGDFAVLRSNRPIRYRPGFSNLVRFNLLFDTSAIGLNNSLQFGGVGTGTDDLYFCIQNGVFGVRRSRDGLFHVEEFTITASAGGLETSTVTLNSVAFNITLSNAGGDIDFTAHQLEIGGTGGTAYTGWNVQHFDDKIYFIADSVGPRNGTYSFSSTGTATGTRATMKAGQALTTEFVAQKDFNGSSPLRYSLDLTKRHMFEIIYSFYGSGDIEFNVLNSATERYENFHTMSFSNVSEDLSLTNPTVFLQRGVASLGSSTALSIKTAGSYGAIIGTQKRQIEPRFAFVVNKTIGASVETVICAFQNRLQVNGYQNTYEIILALLSVSADGNRAVAIKIIKNPTTLSADTTTDYTDFSFLDEANSLTAFDTKSNTYTGGTLIASFVVGKTDSRFFDLQSSEIYLTREDTLIITAESTQTSIVDIGVSVIE